MDRLVRRPLVWAALFVLLGLLLGLRVPFRPLWLLLPAIPLSAAGICFWRKSWQPAVFACLFLAMATMAFAAASRQITAPTLPPDQKTRITGRVDTLPREKDQRLTMMLTDVTLPQGERVPGRVWLYYKPESLPKQGIPKIGQWVTLEVNLRRPKAARNPGGYDFAQYLACEGAYMAAYGYDDWEISGEIRFSLVAWTQGLRQMLSDRLDQVYGSLSPYIRGMVLGDKSDIDPEAMQSIQDSGLSHLLSVSGLHVGFVALPLLWLLDRLRMRKSLRLLLLGLLLGFYCLLVGIPAATVRACLMIMILQIGRVAGRSYDPLSGLAAAFLLFVMVRPLIILNGSFVLSMSAMLGIFLLGPRFQSIFGRLPKWLAGSFSLSLSAQLGCMPFIAVYFGNVQLLGILSNLAAVPLAGVVVSLGTLALPLNFLWAPLAAPLEFAVAVAMRLILTTANLVSSIPFATLRIPSPTGWMIGLYFLAMALCYSGVGIPRWGRIGGIGLCCASVAALMWLSIPPTPFYVQLDVGQGDSAVLRLADQTVVIDTGEEKSSDLVQYLRHEGLQIDALILSHPHSDHAGGLSGLLSNGIRVERIYIGAGLREEDMDEEVIYGLQLASQQHIPILTLEQGDRLAFSQAAIDVLGPNLRLEGDANDHSLMLMIEAGGVRILSCGDAGASAEPLRGTECDVLKVSHHGSRGSSGELFLSRALPEIALISVGEGNLYGHPTEETLDRLAQVGTQTWRTDQSGALTLWISQGQVQVEPFLP